MNKGLILEDVSRNRIITSMKNRVVNLIYYDDPSDEVLAGYRSIEIYAYGTSKAGNPVILAWLRNNMSKTLNSGDANDKIRWRMYRIDRIKSFKNTIQKFDASSEFISQNRPKFNLDYKNLGSIFYKIEPNSKSNEKPEETIDSTTKPLNELFDSPELKNSLDKKEKFAGINKNRMKDLVNSKELDKSNNISEHNFLLDKFIQKNCPSLKEFSDKRIQEDKITTIFDYNDYKKVKVDEFIEIAPMMSVEITKNNKNLFIIKGNFDIDVTADDDNEIFKLKYQKTADEVEFDDENLKKLEELTLYQTIKGIDKLKLFLPILNRRILQFKEYVNNKYEVKI